MNIRFQIRTLSRIDDCSTLISFKSALCWWPQRKGLELGPPSIVNHLPGKELESKASHLKVAEIYFRSDCKVAFVSLYFFPFLVLFSVVLFSILTELDLRN